MEIAAHPLAGEPAAWFVIFLRDSESWWFRRIPGEFKHVRAYGYMPGLKVWLFFEPHHRGITVAAAAYGVEAQAIIDAWRGPEGASETLLVPCIRPGQSRLPLIGFCTTGIAHLLGVRLGAFPTPDRLWQRCLAIGGRPIGRPEIRKAA
jgi:hypothetical protein